MSDPIPPITLIASEPADRLDVWLQHEFPDHSRSSLQRLIRDGHILLNGKSTSPNSSIKPGDEVVLRIPPAQPTNLTPEEIPLEILWEDSHLLVLNKAPGIVVHPALGHQEHTLVHALLHHCKNQLSGIGGIMRPGIVHRLDQDTSGCLVVAKTDEAHHKLADQFHDRTVDKIYLAVVWGQPHRQSGRIEQPIGRHPLHRKKMGIVPDGKHALTEWKCLHSWNTVSLIRCKLYTGRTHQIRIHMASIGHPIVGDAVYGRATFPKEYPTDHPRQLLHAWRLSFNHPIRNEIITCTAPCPSDFLPFIPKDFNFMG
jgi:23S rRNA pseudouridine1911/1915/1917 synthase